MPILLKSLCLTLLAALLPAQLHALTLGVPDNGTSVTLPLTQTLALTLSGNPTTGFTWELESPDQGVLAMEPRPSFVADSDLMGAGGIFTFRFVPRRAGTTSLRLVYHRPWEKGVKPLRVFELTVTVPAPAKGVNHAVYRSTTGELMSASFDLDLDRVTVTLPDGLVVTLPAAVSASGARYSNGSETFWEHQGSGRFFQGEKLIFEGALLPEEEKEAPTREGK